MAANLASTFATLDKEGNHVVVPYEILGEIFTHCDAATLAAVSRVSFACLELTARPLYTDITLSDTRSVAMLFRLESRVEVPGPRTSKSARVTAHTSLSLMHSFTFYGKGAIDVSPLDSYKPFLDPLPIAVLGVSLPTERLTGSSVLKSINLHQILRLFNPRTFVVRGRRSRLLKAMPDTIVVLDAGRSYPEYTAPGLPWNRLQTVIQSGAVIEGAHTRTREGRYRVSNVAGVLGGAGPLSLIWDFLDIDTDPDNEIQGQSLEGFMMTQATVTVDATGPPREHIRAWVETEEIRDGVTAGLRADGGLSVESIEGALGSTVFVEVPSDRVRRLRDDFVEHGVRKDMDWVVLDDL